LPVPVNEVVRVQEHDLLKYAEEETMAGLAESVPRTDAPVAEAVVRRVCVPDAEAEAGVEVGDETATDAVKKSLVSKYSS